MVSLPSCILGTSVLVPKCPDTGKTTESVHCTITGLCLHMRHRPSAGTLQHMTVQIRNIYHPDTSLLCQNVRCQNVLGPKCPGFEVSVGKTSESDRQPNPNPSPFCMEWKQIRVRLVAVRYGSLLDGQAELTCVTGYIKR